VTIDFGRQKAVLPMQEQVSIFLTLEFPKLIDRGLKNQPAFTHNLKIEKSQPTFTIAILREIGWIDFWLFCCYSFFRLLEIYREIY
jgi:hypothetical protein